VPRLRKEYSYTCTPSLGLRSLFWGNYTFTLFPFLSLWSRCTSYRPPVKIFHSVLSLISEIDIYIDIYIDTK